MTENVCIFKLTSGEELVGVYKGENDTLIFVQNPLIIEETLTLDGQTSVLLSTYLPFADTENTLSFLKFHVLQALPVKPEVQNYYWNSLKYNQQFVNSQLEKRLAAVNKNMEVGMAKASSKAVPEASEGSTEPKKVIHMSSVSKAIH